MARRGNIIYQSSNPFDSDEEEKSSNRKSQAPAINPFDDEDNFSRVSVEKERSKRLQYSANPFGSDEEEEHSHLKNRDYSASSSVGDVDNLNENSRRKKGDRAIYHVRGFSASVGESAMRTVEKLKESGVNQAQKVKKSSHKMRIGKASPASSSPVKDPQNALSDNRRSASVDQRSLLFESETPYHSSSFSILPSSAPSRYRNDFRDSGGLENQSVQELEGYAVYKAEETTKAARQCLGIAENIREDATKTLITLNHQGEQITRTHNVAVDIDLDLSRGEKLLGNLGGIFSRTWKPQKSRPINGPLITQEAPFQRRAKHIEQRDELGLNNKTKSRDSERKYEADNDSSHARIEVEKQKQDDALSDLSNVLDQLKEMAIDMGSEIERQNGALEHLGDDVTELSHRVKGANQRGRRLLGK